VLDHERGKINESFILTDQGYHTLMGFTRNSVVQALMRPFVIVGGEVVLETSLQIRHRGVVAQVDAFVLERPPEALDMVCSVSHKDVDIRRPVHTLTGQPARDALEAVYLR